MNILLVEDDTQVADFIQRGLRAEGFSVTVAPDGEQVFHLGDLACFDVIILDLMLPGMSGQDVCRRLRAKQVRVPLLMLSALSDVEDRIAGLRIGADDYLAKPFDFDELLARIEALARRSSSAGDGYRESADTATELRIGELALNRTTVEVSCSGQPVELTPKEREIVQLFLMNPDRALSRERILATVWNVTEDPQTNVVDVYVARLRKRLGRCADSIETVRGIGYRFRSARSSKP